MDTNSKKNKQSIAFRLTFVQVTIIVLVSTSVLLTSGMFLNDYILQNNYNELNSVANSLVQIVKNTGMRDYALVKALTSNMGLQGKTDVILLDYQLNITLSTNSNLITVDDLLPNVLRDAVLGSQSRGVYRNYLFVTKKITGVTDNTLGYVIALSTRDDINAVRNSMFVTVLRIIFIALLLGILFSGYITRRLIEPLQKLENRIREITSGEFAGEIEVFSDDEIGDVTRAFNTMSQQLERYHQAQSRFIQNASHELKSPLMNIQGYAEGLQEGLFSGGEEKNALKIISQESQRLKNVVEELLYISKIDDSVNQLTIVEINVSNLINDAVRTVYTRISQHNIQLNVEIDEELTLSGDYNYLVRAIANLLDNAVRYAKSKISVLVTEQQNHVQIVITDDGPGFIEKDLPKIFERFYKGEHGSTGLGMAIVADIIKRHGGIVKALNQPESGATIVIHLPHKNK